MSVKLAWQRVWLVLVRHHLVLLDDDDDHQDVEQHKEDPGWLVSGYSKAAAEQYRQVKVGTSESCVICFLLLLDSIYKKTEL